MNYVHIIPEVANSRSTQVGEESADIDDHKHRLKSFILKNEKTWEHCIYSVKGKIKGKMWCYKK